MANAFNEVSESGGGSSGAAVTMKDVVDYFAQTISEETKYNIKVANQNPGEGTIGQGLVLTNASGTRAEPAPDVVETDITADSLEDPSGQVAFFRGRKRLRPGPVSECQGHVKINTGAASWLLPNKRGKYHDALCMPALGSELVWTGCFPIPEANSPSLADTTEYLYDQVRKATKVHNEGKDFEREVVLFENSSGTCVGGSGISVDADGAVQLPGGYKFPGTAPTVDSSTLTYDSSQGAVVWQEPNKNPTFENLTLNGRLTGDEVFVNHVSAADSLYVNGSIEMENGGSITIGAGGPEAEARIEVKGYDGSVTAGVLVATQRVQADVIKASGAITGSSTLDIQGDTKLQNVEACNITAVNVTTVGSVESARAELRGPFNYIKMSPQYDEPGHAAILSKRHLLLGTTEHNAPDVDPSLPAGVYDDVTGKYGPALCELQSSQIVVTADAFTVAPCINHCQRAYNGVGVPVTSVLYCNTYPVYVVPGDAVELFPPPLLDSNTPTDYRQRNYIPSSLLVPRAVLELEATGYTISENNDTSLSYTFYANNSAFASGTIVKDRYRNNGILAPVTVSARLRVRTHDPQGVVELEGSITITQDNLARYIRVVPFTVSSYQVTLQVKCGWSGEDPPSAPLIFDQVSLRLA